MKKIALFLFMIFILGIKNLKAAETEPNDSKAQATTLAFNGNNSGAIGTTSDIDWWRVATTGDGNLNVTFTSTNGLYIRCEIYDNDGVIQVASSYTSGTETFTGYGLAAGIYFIKLYAYYSGQLPAYTISNTLTLPAQANDSEPNDSKAQAVTLPLNGSKTGHMGYYYNNRRDSSDWYAVTTIADGRLRLTLASGNGQYIRAYLYDNNGTILIDDGYTSGAAAVINYDGLAAGTYYVQIRQYYSNGYIPYTLSDSLFVPAQSNDQEPNDAKAQAKVLPLNGSVTGHIGYYYNNKRDSSDWYRVSTNGDGRLRLTLSSGNGQYIRAYLYDNNGTIQLWDGYTSGTAAVINYDGLAAGTYYVQIRQYYSNGYIPYTLSDSLFVPDQVNDAEPNDSRSEAIVLPLNSSVTGHTNYYYNNKRDSSDWYKLNTNNDGMLTVTIQTHNGQYIRVYLYDNNGTTVLTSAYTSGTTSIRFDGLMSGAYYVMVKSYYDNGWEPYTLTNTLTTYTNKPDNEPNNYFSQAKTIPSNDSVTGHVAFYYDGVSDVVDHHRLNYTGSGNLTMVLTQENRLAYGSTQYIYIQVYKDTAAGPIYSKYFSSSSSGDINLTNLAQGYYYVKIFMYYSGAGTHFSSYKLTNTFTQVNIASVTLRPTAGADCNSTGSLRIQCSGSLPPYKVQLYNFGTPYGSPVIVSNNNPLNVNNLPTGLWSARVFGDGATGTAFGQVSGASLMPAPTALAASDITSTTARITFSNFSPCVDGYAIQYRKTGDNLWLLDTAKKSPFTLKDLVPATQYTVRVASGDTTNGLTALSRYSDSITFTTLSTGFAAATAASSDDINGQKVANTLITVMPNPAQSQVKLQISAGIDQKVSASLKDMSGRVVWSKFNIHSSVLNNQSIKVTNMPNGIYILHITGPDNKTIATRKIVVAH